VTLSGVSFIMADMDVSRHSTRSTSTFSSLLEDDSHQKIIDEQLTQSLRVVQQHEASLSANLQRGSGGHHIDFERRHRPVRLASEPHERILPQNLVFVEEEDYENEDYVKAMMVQVCVCDEVRATRAARARLAAALPLALTLVLTLCSFRP